MSEDTFVSANSPEVQGTAGTSGVIVNNGWGRLIIVGLVGVMLFAVLAIGILPNIEKRLERRDRERYLTGFLDGLAASGMIESASVKEAETTRERLREMLGFGTEEGEKR